MVIYCQTLRATQCSAAAGVSYTLLICAHDLIFRHGAMMADSAAGISERRARARITNGYVCSFAAEPVSRTHTGSRQL
jgi:hypothetical protein